MLVIAKNAEEVFLKELRIRALNDPTARCLYWRASMLGEYREQWLPIFLARLDHVFLSDPAQAYLCHDGDVFIIARMLTNKILGHISSYLSQKFGAIPSERWMDLFEIGISAERLTTICKAKLENKRIIEQRRAQIAKEEFAPVEFERALQEISKQMISTLAMRRSERTTPEIMVVEDDVFSQKLVCNALSAKYAVNLSSDGQGAIMAYVAKAPDVLFLDIGLPDMDGHMVLERIFKIDPQAYVVMFSGNGSKENIMRAVELGAQGFIGKPFTREKLFRYIEKSPFVQSKQGVDA